MQWTVVEYCNMKFYLLFNDVDIDKLSDLIKKDRI